MSVFAIGVPSFWIDEFATYTASSRSTADLWSMLGNVDTVHGLYYLLMQPLAWLFGPSEIALRMPSAILIGLATAGVTAVGFRLRGYRIALTGGLVFALLPVTSHYGMEARTAAFSVALAVWATYCLIRAIDGERSSRTWWILYTALMVSAVWIFVFTALLLVAHAATLVFTGSPRRWVGFVWSAAVVAVGSVPLLLVLAHQSAQVDWIPPLSLYTIKNSLSAWTFTRLDDATLGGMSGLALSALLWVIVATGIWSTLRDRPMSAGVRQFMSVVVPWVALPTLLLVAASWMDPLFVKRYVFFCTPAFALLVAHGLMAPRRRWVSVVAAFTAVVLAAPVWIADRQVAAKSGLRPLVEVLREEASPGDAILFQFPNQRAVMDAYPDVFSPLDDIALQESGLQAANLFGESVPPKKLRGRMARADRIWVVLRFDERSIPAWQKKTLEQNFTLTRTWQFHRGPLRLYVRNPPPVHVR